MGWRLIESEEEWWEKVAQIHGIHVMYCLGEEYDFELVQLCRFKIYISERLGSIVRMAEGGEDLTSLSLFLSLAVRCVIPIIFLLSSLSSSLIVYKIFFLLVVNCGAGDCAHPASAYSTLRSTSGSACGQLLYTSAFWSKYLHHKSLEISFWVCCKKKMIIVHDRLCSW